MLEKLKAKNTFNVMLAIKVEIDDTLQLYWRWTKIYLLLDQPA